MKNSPTSVARHRGRVRCDETRGGKLLAGSALIGVARVYPLGKLPNGGRLARIGGTCSGSVPETFNVTPCDALFIFSDVGNSFFRHEKISK
jgi:hypothetical protein